MTETKARKPLTVNWPGRGMVILVDDEKSTDGMNAYRKACALARAERIRQEDALFDIYGRGVLSNRTLLCRKLGVERGSPWRGGYSHRTRRARRSAYKLGTYLSQDEVRRWLITYRIDPEQVIDLDSVVVYRDSTVAKITATVYCWNLNRVAPKAFQVVISEMLPLKGNIPEASKMLTCTQARPAPLEWRNAFSHPDEAPYQDRVRPDRAIHSAGKTLMRCPRCHRTEWVRQEVAEG